MKRTLILQKPDSNEVIYKKFDDEIWNIERLKERCEEEGYKKIKIK